MDIAKGFEAIKTMRFIKTLMCSVALVLCSSFFISCGEEDNEIEEYPNWQQTNEAFFNNLTDCHTWVQG